MHRPPNKQGLLLHSLFAEMKKIHDITIGIQHNILVSNMQQNRLGNTEIFPWKYSMYEQGNEFYQTFGCRAVNTDVHCNSKCDQIVPDN